MHEPSTHPKGVSQEALATRWHLAVVRGPDPGWCLPVGRRPARVGRDPGCDLVLDDPAVSRRHLEVRERRGCVEARDLASVNGTRVRRQAHPLPWRRRPRAARVAIALGTRWRRLAPGSDLLAGDSVLRLRPRPGLLGSETAEVGPEEPSRKRRAVSAPSRHRDGAPGDGPGGPPRAGFPTPWLLALSGVPFLVASAAGGSRLALVAVLPLALALAAIRPHSSGVRSFSPPDPAAVLLRAAGSAAPAPASGASSGWLVELAGVVLDPFMAGSLALVGPLPTTRAAGRWLVAQLVAEHGDGELGVVVDPTWQEPWASTLPHAARAGAAPPRLLVVLDGGRATSRPHPSTLPAPGQHAVVVLVDRLDQVPGWCRRVVEVAPSDGHLVSATWASEVASSLVPGAPSPSSPPSRVPVTDLLPDPGAAWLSAGTGLRSPLGVGAEGIVEVDLAQDGPHALVAGTSGSGKSELLLCWVLNLASRYSPGALRVVAIDYKGGATFGPLAGLPHLDALLSDLDAAGTARALAGLRSELQRRERLLADAGARDLDAYRRRREAGATHAGPMPSLPRLLVVVDEFRALAEEHPDLLAGFARLAAQGRSLGIHLVLATQRPGGAMSADLRANIGVAVCLRVLTTADSRDVLGYDDAARLPAVPGRALLGGAGPGDRPALLQGAWSVSEEVLQEHLGRIRAAAERHGPFPREPLWPPPLPEHARAGEHPSQSTTSDPASSLPLLLTDPDGAPRLAPWSWSPLTSPLLVAGTSASGRSTVLLTVATAALNRGWTVHLVRGTTSPGDPWEDLVDHPGIGTVVGADDPRRLVRLLDLLGGAQGPALLCVDDVEAVLAAADRTGGAPGSERLGRLLRDGRTNGLGVAVSGSPEVTAARWAASARHRVLLGPMDAGQVALAGLPRRFVVTRAPAGRGVLVGEGPPVRAQAFLPEPLAPPDLHSSALHSSAAQAQVPRLRPVPLLVTRDDVLARWPAPTTAVAGHGDAAGEPYRLPLGLGDDDGAVVPLELPPRARVVVAGPPDSGRSTALRWMRDRFSAAGREEPLLVDDADLLGPGEAEALARRWRATADSIVVTVRTDALAAGYGGVLGLLREARHVLVLAPLHGGFAHLRPGDVLPHADPAAPRQPGRGVLVTPRRSTIVQLPRH